MSQAKRHTPDTIRLPPELIETLKTVAESEGEAEYQTMVRRWIEERLRQEIMTAG
jgi:predicted DNA binding CopG/RHH family protein